MAMKFSLFLLASFYLILQCIGQVISPSPSSPPKLSGFTVGQADISVNPPLGVGSFKFKKKLSWKYKYGSVTRKLRLVGRDQEAAYLIDKSTKENYTLNVVTNKVSVGGVELGDITTAKVMKIDGFTVGEIRTQFGRFREVGRDNWTRWINGVIYNINVKKRGKKKIRMEEANGVFSVTMDLKKMTITKAEGSDTRTRAITALRFSEVAYMS